MMTTTLAASQSQSNVKTNDKIYNRPLSQTAAWSLVHRYLQKLLGSAKFNWPTEIAWLGFRLYIGLSIMFGAGLAKMPVPGWFVKQVGEIGFTYPSPAFWSYMAAWGEAGGGLLIALGLFTRLSALQLAFQFCIVAFVWYDSPEFMTGMYYQQLIFWTYVLATAIGGGRLSADGLILRWINKKGGQ